MAPVVRQGKIWIVPDRMGTGLAANSGRAEHGAELTGSPLTEESPVKLRADPNYIWDEA